MAARLEHQPTTNPVILGQKMRALLKHRRALERRCSTGDHANRVAAGVTIHAEKGMRSHQ
jgi:hypothetical protein